MSNCKVDTELLQHGVADILMNDARVVLPHLLYLPLGESASLGQGQLLGIASQTFEEVRAVVPRD